MRRESRATALSGAAGDPTPVSRYSPSSACHRHAFGLDDRQSLHPSPVSAGADLGNDHCRRHLAGAAGHSAALRRTPLDRHRGDVDHPAVCDRVTAVPGNFHPGAARRGHHGRRQEPARVRLAGAARMDKEHSPGRPPDRPGMADPVRRRRGRPAGPAGTLPDHGRALAAGPCRDRGRVRDAHVHHRRHCRNSL
ncbi:hypothetical protein D3C71_1344400 [compost metagenome]